MEYIIENRVPDPYDIGSHDISSYLLVNTVGCYSRGSTINIPPTSINRRNGRLDYLVCYVHDGEMEVNINDMKYIVHEGIFIYPPYVKQKYNSIVSESRSTLYWIHFTGYGVDEVLKLCALEGKFIMNFGKLDELPKLFKALVNELNLKQSAFEAMTSSLLITILTLIGRRVSTISSAGDNHKDFRVQKVLDFIRSNYNKQLTLYDLTEVAELSTSRLSCLFKETLGMSPQQYLIKYKIQKACELMSLTSSSISQVASFVGFDDALYFSRIFKKHMGFPPSDYRNHKYSSVFIKD